MRRYANPLNALFSKTRQAILGELLSRGDTWCYISDLARRIGTSPSSLQRELAQLTEAQILLTRRDGNRAYFKANPASPIHVDLRSIFEKTTGLIGVIRDVLLRPFADRVRVAFVFGSAARRELEAGSDIDLLIIGDVGSHDLAKSAHEAETKVGREINVMTFGIDEFRRKVHDGNHFLNAIMSKEKIFVVGNQNELDAITREQHGAGARGDEDGDR